MTGKGGAELVPPEPPVRAGLETDTLGHVPAGCRAGMWIISVDAPHFPTAAAVRMGRHPGVCSLLSGEETAIGKTEFHP